MKQDNEMFDQVVELFKTLDPLTKRSAEKIVADLAINKIKIHDIWKALNLIQTSFGECERCFYLTINNKCPICSDLDRNQSKILVTSSFLEARFIEQNTTYDGLYAITKGEINLSKGISPEKLKIKEIFSRVNLESELILAFNSTFNGEVTANYIKDLAINQEIKVSKLAKGIPAGTTLKTVDQVTLMDAINNRIVEKE